MTASLDEAKESELVSEGLTLLTEAMLTRLVECAFNRIRTMGTIMQRDGL